MASIVDYLKRSGKDSSFSARKKLASEHGIKDYRGSSSQNISLLNSLKGGGAVKAPVVEITSSQSGIQRQPIENPKDYTTYSYNQSRSNVPEYQSSGLVNNYQNRLRRAEANRSNSFRSRYGGQIDSILDSIVNRKEFDLTTDKNYSALYENMRESYLNAGDKAMRDVIGAALGMTGGYGNSYAQIVGSQAYDNYLQNLNTKNIDLMNMAYGMYSDGVRDNYNKLNAVNALDEKDYQRYRDSMSDYYNDRDYLANMYNQERGFDYGKYRDRLAQENYETEFNYKRAQDALAQKNYEDEMAYRRQQDALALAMRGAGSSGTGSGRIRGRGSKRVAKTGEAWHPEVENLINGCKAGKWSNLGAYERMVELLRDGYIDDRDFDKALEAANINEDDAFKSYIAIDEYAKKFPKGESYVKK